MSKIENDILNAALMDILEQDDLKSFIGTGGSGGHLQSIGPGIYQFTMPDGRCVVVDDMGRILQIK